MVAPAQKMITVHIQRAYFVCCTFVRCSGGKIDLEILSKYEPNLESHLAGTTSILSSFIRRQVASSGFKLAHSKYLSL